MDGVCVSCMPPCEVRGEGARNTNFFCLSFWSKSHCFRPFSFGMHETTSLQYNPFQIIGKRIKMGSNKKINQSNIYINHLNDVAVWDPINKYCLMSILLCRAVPSNKSTFLIMNETPQPHKSYPIPPCPLSPFSSQTQTQNLKWRAQKHYRPTQRKTDNEGGRRRWRHRIFDGSSWSTCYGEK